jgi:formylglycine-generating enzyme required for sulfatase activity
MCCRRLAPKQNNELVALVGLTDEHVARSLPGSPSWPVRASPHWAADYGRDEYGPFADLTIKGVTQRFRYIPSGTYMMGSPEDEVGRDKDETRVRVTLTHSFWMADSECTQAFWDQVVGKDNSRFPGLERPVERVSWDDCKSFCVTLSQSIPGLRARLPTEAEWEYACRAGVQGPYPGAQGPVGVEKLDAIAWFDKDTRHHPGREAPAVQPPRTCATCSATSGSGAKTTTAATRPPPRPIPIGREQETRVARGGSWGDGATKVRAANRLAVRPDMRTLYLGMRLVVAVDWPPGQEPGAGIYAAAEIPVIAPPCSDLAPLPARRPARQPRLRPSRQAPARRSAHQRQRRPNQPSSRPHPPPPLVLRPVRLLPSPVKPTH